MTSEQEARDALREHLLRRRIAGQVATPRENNLRNYRLMADRDPYYLCGLQPARPWTADQVLALMARRVGVSPDPAHRYGADTIDPDLTLDGLDRFADRLARAGRDRQRVLIATGHPAALLTLHLRLAEALSAAGCPLVQVGADWMYQASAVHGKSHRVIQYIGGVGVIQEGGSLVHTHSARPVRAVLNLLAGERDADAGALPGLVVADHGWAGGAGQAGLDSICFADSNDPALFVGEEEGAVRVAVPLDDGVPTRHYLPIADYLIDRAGLRRLAADYR
jgi:hypothetical protein